MVDKTEEKVFKKHESKVTIPQIVAAHIAAVMVDSVNMRYMEVALDSYIKSLSPEEKQAIREDTRKQLTLGRQALESMLTRFLSS